MKQFEIYVILCVLSIFLTGCGSLTAAQVAAINSACFEAVCSSVKSLFASDDGKTENEAEQAEKTAESTEQGK